jgi:UDP-N-acetyl-D-glucosamine dehydrogenase
MTPNTKQALLHKLNTHSAAVAVIGLGYVGLPLAVAFAESGFSVFGIDVDPSKVDAINQGRSYISDIPSDRVRQLTIDHWQLTIDHSPPSPLTATTDYSLLAHCDVAIICVPTPLNKTRDPDVRYHDPYVAQFAHNGHGLRSEPDLEPALRSADCVVIVTDHSVYDWRHVSRMATALVDTRNVVSQAC